MQGYCKLYSLICDPDVKIWIFEFSLAVCSTESHGLVFSLGYLGSNGRRVLLGGHQIRRFYHSLRAQETPSCMHNKNRYHTLR
jgi:hypothetical protein